MNYFSTVISIATAMIMFLGTIFGGGLPVATVPETPEVYDDTVMFVSDFQSNIKDFSGVNRQSNFDAVLNAVDNENPGLVVGGGDYQSAFLGTLGSAFGISLLRDAVGKKWDYKMQYLFAQGNHDAPKSRCINDTGLYEFDNYAVYLINEDDFPWNEQLDLGLMKDTVQKTAAKLNEALGTLSDNGDTRPVFVVSHLPLHFSERSSNKDNRYASYIFDVLNNYSASLNIVYLYGHNHSKGYDDYIGGAVNYLAKGDTMKIGGTGDEKTLGFTYTNCGYIGYSNNSDSDTSTSDLSATFISVSGNALSIRKYSKDGMFMEKTVDALTALAPAA